MPHLFISVYILPKWQKYFGFGLKEEKFFFMGCARANALACPMFTPFPHPVADTHVDKFSFSLYYVYQSD